MRRLLPVLLVLLLPVPTGCVLANSNLREVVPCRLYRSGQMNAEELRRNVESLGVRTVVNLRGGDASARWWREEAAICRELGVGYHTFSWRENRLPDPASLASFVGVLRDAPEPVLVHCKAGVQRAAVGSAVYLLREGASTCEARDQFDIFFLNARIGDVVSLYHGSTLPFDRWVEEVYPVLYRESPEGRCVSLSGDR